MSFFSRLTIILILVVVLFTLLTHRVLISNQEPIQNIQIEWKQIQQFLKENPQHLHMDLSFSNLTNLIRSASKENKAKPLIIQDVSETVTQWPRTAEPNRLQTSELRESHTIDQMANIAPQSQPLESVTQKTESMQKDVTISIVQQTSSKTSDEAIKPHKKHEKMKFIDPKAVPELPKLNHPMVSPREGSDISTESQRLELLQCPNQSSCVVPALELKIKTRIYFCKMPKRGGIRFFFLAREGFLLHPNVVMVDYSEIDTADYIIYLPASAPAALSECNRTEYKPKLIVLDEFDGHNPLYEPLPTMKLMINAYGPHMIWYFMYFKRSYVTRRDGVFNRYPHLTRHDIFPMTYPLAEAYIQLKFNQIREIEIMCTLRGTKEMTTRQRTTDWVAEYVKSREVKNAVVGPLNTATRTTIDKTYFEYLHNSRIIVTVNPANWEGDFRLWETMSSGALVFVDPLFVPHPYPMIDGVHIIYYNNHNKTDLFAKLDYYRSHPEIAKKIAHHGYLHAMKYHRTVNLADYVLKSAHLKRTTYKGLETPKYKYSAQYLKYEAIRQHDMIRLTHTPGVYSPLRVMKNHTHIRE